MTYESILKIKYILEDAKNVRITCNILVVTHTILNILPHNEPQNGLSMTH